MTEPIYKELTFKIQESERSAEIINLLSQVMNQYKDDLAINETDAIAHWFFKNYGFTDKK